MRKSIITILALAVLTTVAIANTRSPKKNIENSVSTFSAVIKELQTNYVDSIELDNIVKTGIDAMLYKLDPYTEYFPKKEQKEFRSLNAGEYAGIGSYIMERDSAVWISGPHEGSPAAKAGLRHGDKILEVDGVNVLGMKSDQVSDRLKGTRGTQVVIKVQRPYVEDSILTFTLTRDKINIPAVSYYGLVGPDRDLGYIQLSQFSEKSASEVKAALQDLIDNDHIKGLVLDLRDNGGGYLERAVQILGYFLPKGTEVLRTRGRELLDEKVYKTTSKPIAPNLPLAILTDGATASASEITAGALQDLDRAVTVGTRTFGKGLVQTTFGLPDEAMIKITTAKYYIPSGRLIQAIDYSHRNANGQAERIADSLTNEFRTAGGRTVRDGGGITPDITVEYPEISRTTYNVVTDNWAFDFANKYRAEHPTLAVPSEFQLTDTIFADFKAFVDPKKFNRDFVCTTALDQLRKLAKIEGYMSDSLSAEFDRLGQMMTTPLETDLDNNRQAMTPYLEREIVSRYYGQRGEIENTLRHDPGLDAAVAVLLDTERYNKILKPADPTDKRK